MAAQWVAWDRVDPILVAGREKTGMTAYEFRSLFGIQERILLVFVFRGGNQAPRRAADGALSPLGPAGSVVWDGSGREHPWCGCCKPCGGRPTVPANALADDTPINTMNCFAEPPRGDPAPLAMAGKGRLPPALARRHHPR